MVGKEICKAWGHSGIGGHRNGGCQAPVLQPARRSGYLKKVSGLRLAVQGIRGVGFSRGNLKGLDKAGEEEDDGEDIWFPLLTNLEGEQAQKVSEGDKSQNKNALRWEDINLTVPEGTSTKSLGRGRD